jgi:hypothetical protein
MTNPNYAWDRFVPTTTRPEPLTTTFTEPEASTTLVPSGMIVPGEVIASSGAESLRQVARIEVGREGAIRFHDDATAGRETVAEVTADTFYAKTQSATAAGNCASNRVSVLTYLTLTVDLNAIAEAVKSAQRNDGQTTDPDKRVYVGSEGELRMGNEAFGAERIAEVTGDTFYTGTANLDAIARAIREAQANSGQFVDPSKRVYVGSEGELRQGNMAAGGERISEITGDTFYAPSRLETESAFVRGNMPRNTMRVSDGTYEGWHFTITNEFGDSYSLFLYYHPSYGVYRVALIDPRMEGTADAHGTHLWPDGTLCLTHATGSGYPSIGASYAKAALWTRGASCYRRGYGFQFNIGQD